MGHYESSVKRRVHSTKCLHKVEKAHAIDLTAHLKALEQKEADSPRSRWHEIIKLRAEINNKRETKKTIQGINETKSWFFEKINMTDKILSKLIKRQRENVQINKTRKERETKQETPRKSRESLGHTTKNLYSTKLEYVKEMDNFMDRHITKLNQEHMNNLIRPRTCNLIKAVIQSLPTK